jgi:deoxyadenosine/deoxycytidine kinase
MKIANGNFLVIEGNIGAGKTALCQMLATDFNSSLILEEFSDNPFLPLFYKEPDRYAFPVELFFMTERHKQLQKMLLERDLFSEYVVADYIFSKTLLFARENLKGEEFRLFQRLYDTLDSNFPKPDLMLYLHRDVKQLRANILKRNRPYELQISDTYLEGIQSAYFNFFRTSRQIPIVVLNLGDIDFIHNKNAYLFIRDLLQTKFKPGLHTIQISGL